MVKSAAYTVYSRKYGTLKKWIVLLFSLQQTVEKSLFLNYFYKHCMHRLMAPLMAQTAGSKVSRGEWWILNITVFIFSLSRAHSFSLSLTYLFILQLSLPLFLPFSPVLSLSLPPSSLPTPLFSASSSHSLPPSFPPSFQTPLRMPLCSLTFSIFSLSVSGDTLTSLGITSLAKAFYRECWSS